MEKDVYKCSCEKWGVHQVDNALINGWKLEDIERGYRIVSIELNNYTDKEYLKKYPHLQMKVISFLDLYAMKEIMTIDEDTIKMDYKLYSKLREINPLNYQMMYPLKCKENDYVLQCLNSSIGIEDIQLTFNHVFHHINSQLKEIYQLTQSQYDRSIKEREGIIQTYMPIDLKNHEKIQDIINISLLESYSQIRIELNEACEITKLSIIYSLNSDNSFNNAKQQIYYAMQEIEEDILLKLKQDLIQAQQLIEEQEELEENQYEERERCI